MSKWQPEHQYAVPLTRFNSKDDFLFRLVSVNETLVHYFEPENKAKNRQYVGPWSPRPERGSRHNHLPTVLWDAKGDIMLDFLLKRSTITGVYYANLLDQIRAAIRKNTPR